jgi:hypothetical protein
LRELAAAQKIARLDTAEERERVIDEVRALRSGQVMASELDIATGRDPDARANWCPLSDDDLAMLVIADSRRAAILRAAIKEIERWKSEGGRVADGAEEMFRITSDDLTESEKRRGRRVRKRWSTDRWVFRKGTPPYRYAKLVEIDIDFIAQLTGHEFRFSGATERRSGVRVPPRGPEFKVLVAALDLQLFASGAPPRETIASIVRQRRKQRITSADR